MKYSDNGCCFGSENVCVCVCVCVWGASWMLRGTLSAQALSIPTLAATTIT